MNAITVNYAEIDSNSVPRSFGLAYTSLLTNGGFFVDGASHIFNASVKELTGTPYSLVQGRDFSYDKDIIVTTASPSSTSLNALRGVENQAWINFYQPAWDNDSFIWLDYNPETGKFYTMVEKDTFPDEKEIGYSVQVSRVLENENGCYNQVALTTKAALASAADANKVIIKHNGLVLFTLDSTLKVLKENANDDNFVTLSNNIADSYQVDEYASYIDPTLTVWTHEGTEVTPGIELVSSSGVVKKYTESVSGDQHLYQVLTGNNEVKFYRKRKDLVVNLTITGDASNLGSAGAYVNGNEDSYFDNNKLIVPDVKYGRTLIDIRNYFNNANKVSFNPNIISLYTGGQFNSTATITIGDITDYIVFTGFTSDGAVSQKRIEVSHGSLPKTYTLADMITNKLDNVDIADCKEYLKYEGSNKFKRQREVCKENWDWWIAVGWTNYRSSTYIDNTTKTYDKYWKENFWRDNRHELLTETESNRISQTFRVTAHYNGIPAAVSVDTPNVAAQATDSQVVLFRGNYYVANNDMKTRVESLVSGVTVTARKDWPEEQDKPWSVQFVQNFWYVKPTTKQGETQAVFDKYEYGQQNTAYITIYGKGATVTNITSSDSRVSVQRNSAGIDANHPDKLLVQYTCSVNAATEQHEGYSLSNASNTSVTGSQTPTTSIDRQIWGQKETVTYKFFN